MQCSIASSYFICLLFQSETGSVFYTVNVVPVIFFFFSSRRRHTRLVSDWSSDVCSSDLGGHVQYVGRTWIAIRAISETGPESQSMCVLRTARDLLDRQTLDHESRLRGADRKSVV